MRVRFGLANGRVNFIGVVAIDIRDHLPAIRGETHRRVVAKPAFDFAVNRDAVVVVERDQFAQTERAREAADLVRNAFHQATIAEKHIGVMIDHVKAVNIECAREFALGNRHADRVGQPLTERPGGGLDTRGDTDFRMPRRFGMQLPEVLDLFHRQVVTGQMQE